LKRFWLHVHTAPNIGRASRTFDAPRRSPWCDPPDGLTLTHDDVHVWRVALEAHEGVARQLECTSREVREILRMAQQPVSLEKPIGEEEESELGDFVEDDQIESPDEHASLSLRREDIEHALSSLPERERKVIELRFGLTGGQPCTLEEVGKAFGVTRERIRQIENNTLKKLESLPEAQGLKDCV